MSLEQEIDDFSLDYNISDIFIPLKPIRLLPGIMRIKDPFLRYLETSVNAVLVGIQITTYYTLYEFLRISK